MALSQRVRLETAFKKFSVDGLLPKKSFADAVVGEIVDLVLKKANDVTVERWEDLKSIGVLNEVWEACFGECRGIKYNDYVSVFKTDAMEEKSEVEKLVDLCSEDEALRNQIVDLEQCLQNEKDLLAGTDIMLEEQTEKNRLGQDELEKTKLEVDCLTRRLSEFETLRAKIKTMDSEQRLLKRDFDLVFATNKSVQKKMEKAEMENRALRKTIVHMASQLEKAEREQKEQCKTVGEIEHQEVESVSLEGWNKNNNNNPKQPHLVWDPAVRALVPITAETIKAPKKKPHHHNKRTPQFNNHKKKRWNDHDNLNNGRLISPFPRRYTSSHIPRYRRKYEMSELSRVQNAL